MSKLPEIPADLPVIFSCGEVVSYGLGDRYSHTYCDRLPKGHDGEHTAHAAQHRVTREWARVLLPYLYAASLRHARQELFAAFDAPPSGVVVADFLRRLANEAEHG